MRRKHRFLSLLAAAALCLGLSIPLPVSAAGLYFTAINDSMPRLTADTMPFWSGGMIYVPYTVFDANLNGVSVSLGLYTSYNRSSNTVTLFNLRQMLVFDLSSGSCRDELTGEIYASQAIMRNGRPYLALSIVCSIFGLQYSYTQLPNVSQGYLVRIKSADAVLDDARFIERGRDLINNRLREYTQSLNPAESTDPGTASQPSTPPEVNSSDTAVYLAFRCGEAQGLEGILDALDSGRQYAVFFLPPGLIEQERDLVRRILGSGHCLGILAEEEEGVRALLEQGSLALEESACTRTTLAYAPPGQRAALKQEGWVCWEETLALEPSETVGANTFAANVLSRMGTGRRAVYLTLKGGESTARVLPALLRQMDSSHYTVAIPMETRF